MCCSTVDNLIGAFVAHCRPVDKEIDQFWASLSDTPMRTRSWRALVRTAATNVQLCQDA